MSGDLFDHRNVEVAEGKVILVLIICVHGQSRFVQFFLVCEATAVSASTVVACLRSATEIRFDRIEAKFAQPQVNNVFRFAV